MKAIATNRMLSLCMRLIVVVKYVEFLVVSSEELKMSIQRIFTWKRFEAFCLPLNIS